MAIWSQEDAKKMIINFVNDWKSRTHFFMGAFLKESKQFVAQLYVGPIDWDLPEFGIGYFVDVDHEGKGYVTEAVKAIIATLFEKLNAHKIWKAGIYRFYTLVRKY